MHDPTIFHWLTRAALQHPDTVALLSPHKTSLSFAGLLQQTQSLGAQLQHLGIETHNRVAIVMANGDSMAVTCLATASFAACAPLNPEYSATEFEFYLSDLQADLLILDPNLQTQARIAAAALQIPVLEISADSHQTGILHFSESISKSLNATPSTAEDIAFLLHTSGTTAQPKLVPLNHKNLATTAKNLRQTLGLSAKDRCLNTMPMFHIGALVDMLISPLSAGSSVVCCEGFDVRQLPHWLITTQPSWVQWAPIHLQNIWSFYQNQVDELTAITQLRLIRIVAAALSPTLQTQFENQFQVPVVEVYGMTETTTLIASQSSDPKQRRTGSVGISCGPDIAVANEEGHLLEADQNGEIVVRGPSIMCGYLSPAGVNTNSYFGEWFRTGDFGCLDADGYLYIRGRIKEIVNRGGEKISPQEVDRALLQTPGIIEAASFGLAHDQLGEELVAAMVVKTEASPSTSDLKALLRQQLAYFKIPSQYFIVDSLPKTATGKIQRSKLPEWVRIHTLYSLNDDQAVANGSQKKEPCRVYPALEHIWQTLLDCDSIQAEDDFFDLGGDSLKALSLMAEIKKHSGENLFVTVIFDYPIYADFVAELEKEYPRVLQKLTGEGTIQNPYATRPPLQKQHFEIASSLFRSLCDAHSPPSTRADSSALILCPPRSGSTLLRIMLAGHSQLFVPPELYLHNFNTLEERQRWFATSSQRGHLEGNLRALMALFNEDARQAEQRIQKLLSSQCDVATYLQHLTEWSKPRLLVDKTPFYSAHPDNLERAEARIQKARYIHLTRHPYAMMRSFIEVRMDQFWYPRLLGESHARKHPNPLNPSQMAELVWLHVHQNNLDFLQKIDPSRQIHLRYENLVKDPKTEMQRLCDFLEISFDTALLKPYDNAPARMTDGLHAQSQMIGDVKFEDHDSVHEQSVHRWKDFFSEDFLHPHTRELAQAFGYTDFQPGTDTREEFEF